MKSSVLNYLNFSKLLLRDNNIFRFSSHALVLIIIVVIYIYIYIFVDDWGQQY